MCAGRSTPVYNRASLNQILSAKRQQAAADECDIGSGVIGKHLTHAVANTPVCLPKRVDFRPCVEKQLASGEHVCDLIETLRMARYDNQQMRVTILMLLPCIQQQSLFASRVLAAKNTYGRTELLTQ